MCVGGPQIPPIGPQIWDCLPWVSIPFGSSKPGAPPATLFEGHHRSLQTVCEVRLLPRSFLKEAYGLPIKPACAPFMHKGQFRKNNVKENEKLYPILGEEDPIL